MKRVLCLMALLGSVAAFADTTVLPDPNVTVNLASGVTVATYYTRDADGNILTAKTYRGPSLFAYVSECARQDGPKYHCNVEQETGVVLKAPDSTTVVANITAQFAATLITSGHNYWRQSALLLSGDLTR